MRTLLLQFRNAVQTTDTLVTDTVLPSGGSWSVTYHPRRCLFGPLRQFVGVLQPILWPQPVPATAIRMAGDGRAMGLGDERLPFVPLTTR